MAMIHVPTVYLLLSFLYILMPIAVWMALGNQKSKPILWWCVGGELFAIGLLLIGLRASIPNWLSYTVANGLSWFAILIQAMALRRVLKQTPVIRKTLALVLCWLLVFEFFRLVVGNPSLRFGWSLLFFVGAFSYVAYLARQIWVSHALKNARLLFAIYFAATAILCVRILRLALGYAQPDAMAQGFDSILIVFSGVLVAVLGNFTFVGLYIERANRREMAATADRVRQEESARLGAQIAQLERQRTLGAMSYSFAHELSQPLTAILMDTHTIKNGLKHAPLDMNQIQASIQDVERSANLTVQLIERIRNFIRPTQNAYDVVDMKLLVLDVRHLLAHEIRTQDVKFEWEFDEAPCLVHGDKVQLSQIVLNVYRNAMQSMAKDESRKIFVSLDQENQRVVLRVHDSGPGLDEALKDKLGQPFVTTKTDGLGVGLSISNTIAEMHSGSLNITNAVGGGALVELNLPAVAR